MSSRTASASSGNADGAHVAAAAAQAINKPAASVLNNGPVLSSLGGNGRYDTTPLPKQF
jgi:hypothetical protein